MYVMVARITLWTLASYSRLEILFLLISGPSPLLRSMFSCTNWLGANKLNLTQLIISRKCAALLSQSYLIQRIPANRISISEWTPTEFRDKNLTTSGNERQTNSLDATTIRKNLTIRLIIRFWIRCWCRLLAFKYKRKAFTSVVCGSSSKAQICCFISFIPRNFAAMYSSTTPSLCTDALSDNIQS